MGECSYHQLVRQYTGSVFESKQGVVCEDGAHAQQVSVKDSFVTERRKRGMRVN